MNDIHQNLAPIEPAFFTVFDWVVVGLVVVGIGVILWKLFVNRRSIVEDKIVNKPSVKKFVPEPFIFDKELNHIVELKEKSQWKDFSLEATTLLKRILEHEYKVPFDFATGKEMQEIMAKKNISTQKKQELKYFFQLIDPIKFAHAQGKEDIAKEIVDILKDYNNYFKK
jgi:hypothetical protein